MTRSSEDKIIRKVYISGEEHEILYSENELEEEFKMINELEERKSKIKDCLKMKVNENEKISKENDKLICKVEETTNEILNLEAQLKKDRSYYELKKTQFCKKMMRNHKKSIGLLTEDSIESIATRLEGSDSLPSLNCRRLLHLHKQWRIITYNNCENFLRLDQYKNEVISEISTIRREFKKAKFEILGSHRESTLQYLYLIGKQKTGKGHIKMHKDKENQIIERMKMLKTENEKLKKLFQDLYERIGSIGDDEEDTISANNEEKCGESSSHNDKKCLNLNDADQNLKKNEKNNNCLRDDLSITSTSSESILFDGSCIHAKDSRVSVNGSCSSGSYDNNYYLSNNRGSYSIHKCTNSDVQLNRNSSLGLNDSDSFISLHDIKGSKSSKHKRHVTFRDRAVGLNEEANMKSSRTIQEEEIPDATPEEMRFASSLEEKKSGKEFVQVNPCLVDNNLLKQSWKDEFNERKSLVRTSSSFSNTSSNLNKHDSGIDNNSSNGSSLRDLSVDELIKVQDRIFNLEMNLKLNECKTNTSKVNQGKCQKKMD